MKFNPSAINLDNKLSKVSKHRTPHIIAQLNNLHIKCVKALGEFVWRKHEDTNEFFCASGKSNEAVEKPHCCGISSS